MGELYTCKDIAERYGVQIITVWEWIRKKKLGAIKIGKETKKIVYQNIFLRYSDDK